MSQFVSVVFRSNTKISHKCVKIFQTGDGGSSYAEPIICNNLERALLLSLKYQFVTPLTSLVVIKPDVIEDGDIQEADMFNRKIRVMSGASCVSPVIVFLLISQTILNLPLTSSV